MFKKVCNVSPRYYNSTVTDHKPVECHLYPFLSFVVPCDFETVTTLPSAILV